MHKFSWFNKLTIGGKLNLGFSLLVALTLFASSLSYFGSLPATQNIQRTNEVSVPTTLASAQAQANLLRMLRDVGGYLALGQPNLRQRYHESRYLFERDLAQLNQLSVNFSPENKLRVEKLQMAFQKWSDFPEKLFSLRDDQLEREPAYRILATDGVLLGGNVLLDTRKLIETQKERPISAENITLMADLANFQGSFASCLAGLRGYVTTRNGSFRSEYEANLAVNQFAWEHLMRQQALFTPEQQAILTQIATNKAKFLELPPKMFAILESETWRADLHLFDEEAEPLANEMLQLLADIVADQQTILQEDLTRGNYLLNLSRDQILWGGVIAVVFGLVMAFGLQRNITRPINDLTITATKITQGDLNIQAQIMSHDEIGVLAQAFNTMTARLHDLIENLEDRVHERTQEIQVLLQEREQTIAKLQELDRLKSEFLTSITHELRTPLNGILGFADILLEGIDGDLSPEARNDVEFIRQSGQNLLGIISDLLDISKIEGGMMRLQLEPLEVSALLDELRIGLKRVFADKPLPLSLEVAADLPLIEVDHVRIFQILSNLLNNALKFTHKGEIRVKAYGVNLAPGQILTEIPQPAAQLPYTHICFVVMDTGIGIPLDQQTTIFERFKQVDMSKTRHYEGVGLGLAICKDLVRLHGGQIGVQSEVGVGSQFWFVVAVFDKEL